MMKSFFGRKFFMCILFISISEQKELFKCNEIKYKFRSASSILNQGTEFACEIANIHQVSDISEALEGMIVENISSAHLSFSNISNIKILNSTILKLPIVMFSKLTHLRVFSADNSNLMQIYREDFKDAHQLTTLNVRQNMITSLEDAIFIHLKEVKKVDLSHNKISALNEETFKGTSDSLMMIDLSHNKITILDYSTLIPLAHKKSFPLELYLDFNEIKEVKESHSVHHLKFQRMSLKNNHLQSFSCPDIKIQELRLDHNHLQSISLDNCSVEYIEVTSNKLKWLHLHADLRGLVASKNNIKSFLIGENSEMYHMEMSENEDISHTFPTLKTLGRMKYLNLSHSFIGVLQEDSFAEMYDLKYLYLHSCGIRIIPFEVFASNKHLLTLDISNNLLETIDLHMFTGLEKLHFLDISGNKLSQIEDIEKIRNVLPELKEINIEGNPWKCLGLSTMIRTLNQLNVKISENKSRNGDVENISGIPCY